MWEIRDVREFRIIIHDSLMIFKKEVIHMPKGKGYPSTSKPKPGKKPRK